MQEENVRKGPWFEEEDEQLKRFVSLLGERRWDSLARASGLRRSGKSCRLRWLNYLWPSLKHGPMSVEEEQIILQLHEKWGNKSSKIAPSLPCRTDNEIKNYWRTHLRKKLKTQTPDAISSKNNQTNCSEQNLSFQTSTHKVTQERSKNNPCIIFKDNHIIREKNDPFSFIEELQTDPLSTSLPPHGNRVLDWMAMLSREKNEMNYWDNRGLEFCFCYPFWSLEEGSMSGAWECHDTLWDIDLFTSFECENFG